MFACPALLRVFVAAVRSSKATLQSRILQVQAAAKSEAGDSEQGRLVRDALEFNAAQASQDQPAVPAASLQQEERKVGDLLGSKYKIVELLAKGKSGLVYKVQALRLLRLLAGMDSSCSV